MSACICGSRKEPNLAGTAEVTEARCKTSQVRGVTIDGSGRQILLWLESSKCTRECESDNSLERRRIFWDIFPD